MSDDAGRLRLKNPSDDRDSFDFGTVTGISETFQKSCSVTPIVTRSKQAAFPLETRTYKQIHINFTRKNPISVNNGSSSPLMWDNRTWQTKIMASLDRWQARTNGYELVYEPKSDNPYVAPIDEQGYVKSLTLKTVQGRPESIQGTLEFHVGSMRILNRTDPGADSGVKVDDFSVVISSSDGNTEYPLLWRVDDEKMLNLVDSLTITGGPEAPFEYVQMTIPRKNLSSAYPALMSASESDLKPGHNRIVVSMAETSTFTLTKVKSTSSTITLTGYCNAERLRGAVIPNDASMAPPMWIDHILGGSYGVTFKDDALVRNYKAPESEMIQSAREDIGLSFTEGTNVWFVLQVAAMICGARVFFAQDKAYVIDYSLITGAKEVDLYSGDPDKLDCSMAVVGDVELGDEGTDTIVNTLKVSCRTPNVDTSTKTYVRDENGAISYKQYELPVEDSASRKVYGDYDGGTYYITGLRQRDKSANVNFSPPESDSDAEEGTEEGTTETKEGYETYYFNQAQRFGDNLLKYLSEAQQTVTFTLREQTGEDAAVWAPFFQPNATVRSMSDEVDDIYVDNESDVTEGDRKPQKLALKTYTRNYPECTTEYTWGVLASMDLSSSTSKILSNISQ